MSYYPQYPHTPQSSTYQDAPNPQNRLEVIGEGSVAAAPDQASITLGAITEDVSLQTAQTQNAAMVTNIISSLLNLNIPKQNIQTVTYRIDIEYNYADGIQTLRGYKVTHLLQVTVDRTEQTGTIVDTAVKNGANTVSSIQFSVKHPNAYYNQALTSAIHNAQQKALTMANALGVTLVRTPVQVQELSRQQEPTPFQPVMFSAVSAPATPIQPGELSISAAVKVQFTYY
ncbi:DUF541 domain-containing protein [Paenibacillus sp. H1-7]|uniref:SIMPL domain-containing protein n=1 Tax=Paenibacillus sp. H1-7 TaxID=2282849 RepID=UPI001EF90C47|nr:SIMPL domain-containing protein [Paenibacillus sp. H1-7]ULL14557.1 DUF541 domain-containing protein [Paenibacillus sp. H1-7]